MKGVAWILLPGSLPPVPLLSFAQDIWRASPLHEPISVAPVDIFDSIKEASG